MINGSVSTKKEAAFHFAWHLLSSTHRWPTLTSHVGSALFNRALETEHNADGTCLIMEVFPVCRLTDTTERLKTTYFSFFRFVYTIGGSVGQLRLLPMTLSDLTFKVISPYGSRVFHISCLGNCDVCEPRLSQRDRGTRCHLKSRHLLPKCTKSHI